MVLQPANNTSATIMARATARPSVSLQEVVSTTLGSLPNQRFELLANRFINDQPQLSASVPSERLSARIAIRSSRTSLHNRTVIILRHCGGGCPGWRGIRRLHRGIIFSGRGRFLDVIGICATDE
jgi:hypothetical protein